MSERQPVLRTPTGGAVSRPKSPAEWHSHPYVWAWLVSLGATSRTYIERECKAAQEAGAPTDAVYRARVDDPSIPGAWVTVDMVIKPESQTRVREYAKALIAWEIALKRSHPTFQKPETRESASACPPAAQLPTEAPASPQPAEAPAAAEDTVRDAAAMPAKRRSLRLAPRSNRQP